MKKKAAYVAPVAEVVVIATPQLLSASPFDLTDGESTSGGFVDGNESIDPGNAL